MRIDEILLDDTDPRPVDNFTADDLHQLEQIRDLNKAKEFALTLITRPSQKPLTPKKRSWFTGKISAAKRPEEVVRIMWNMLMSGEGHGVLGTAGSTEPSKYRTQFGESDDGYMFRAYEMDPLYGMTPDGGVHQLNGKRHDAAALPIGSVVLDAQEHDAGQISYTLFVKVGEGSNIMDEAFESKGFLKISSYTDDPNELKAAFVNQARGLLV